MRAFFSLFALLFGLTLLSGCQDGAVDDFAPKANRELPAKILQKMQAKGMSKNSPVYFRLFKDEHVLEVWKQKNNGKFDMIQNYNICAWSGTLGPKVKQGDRQAPEGYYPIRPAQMNPSSKYFLAINTGFPNAYDRAHGRNGSDLMIHGACSSSGCYSMTDENVQQIFAFARDAFAGGQTEIMLEALPFRLTAEKMALFSTHKDFAFWQMLREGYDAFELTKIPPKVDFCEKKYVFNRIAGDGAAFSASAACPPSQPRWPQLAPALSSYDEKYQSSFAAASKRFEGVPFPIVHGGASRPLDKHWKPQPVTAGPSADALAALARRKAGAGGAAVAASDAAADEAAATPVPGDKVAPGDAAKTAAAKTAAAPGVAPVETESATAAPATVKTADTVLVKADDGSVVPLPGDNPNKAAAAAAAPEPVKKKRRLWPFNNGS